MVKLTCSSESSKYPVKFLIYDPNKESLKKKIDEIGENESIELEKGRYKIKAASKNRSMEKNIHLEEKLELIFDFSKPKKQTQKFNWTKISEFIWKIFLIISFLSFGYFLYLL